MEQTLFKIDEIEISITLAPIQNPNKKYTCRHCRHRERWETSFGDRIKQCCRLQPNNRNYRGYKYIKVTDTACLMFVQY